jgi:D-proline reductase (dithiol) PrdB
VTVGDLSSATVALLSAAGLVPPGGEPFDREARGGDWSWRAIPADVDVGSLRDFHRSRAFDHSGLAADHNLAFPLDRLRELVSQGLVGRVAPRHASVMGSVTAPGRLIRYTLPEIAETLVSDGVDVALLVPV